MAIEIDISDVDNTGEVLAHLIRGLVDESIKKGSYHQSSADPELDIVIQIPKTRFSLPMSMWVATSLESAGNVYGRVVWDILWRECYDRIVTALFKTLDSRGLNWKLTKPEFHGSSKLDGKNNLVHISLSGSIRLSIGSPFHTWVGPAIDNNLTRDDLLNKANWQARAR